MASSSSLSVRLAAYASRYVAATVEMNGLASSGELKHACGEMVLHASGSGSTPDRSHPTLAPTCETKDASSVFALGTDSADSYLNPSAACQRNADANNTKANVGPRSTT